LMHPLASAASIETVAIAAAKTVASIHFMIVLRI
jgi:hypothetical protein